MLSLDVTLIFTFLWAHWSSPFPLRHVLVLTRRIPMLMISNSGTFAIMTPFFLAKRHVHNLGVFLHTCLKCHLLSLNIVSSFISTLSAVSKCVFQCWQSFVLTPFLLPPQNCVIALFKWNLFCSFVHLGISKGFCTRTSSSGSLFLSHFYKCFFPFFLWLCDTTF